MTPIVLDASAAATAVIGTQATLAEFTFHSHAGLDIEVVSVLRRLVGQGALPANAARESLDYLRAMTITRHPLGRLLARIWELRHDITAYDAGYVALAEALDIPLLTLDRRLGRTAAHYCDVVVPW